MDICPYTMQQCLQHNQCTPMSSIESICTKCTPLHYNSFIIYPYWKITKTGYRTENQWHWRLRIIYSSHYSVSHKRISLHSRFTRCQLFVQKQSIALTIELLYNSKWLDFKTKHNLPKKNMQTVVLTTVSLHQKQCISVVCCTYLWINSGRLTLRTDMRLLGKSKHTAQLGHN